MKKIVISKKNTGIIRKMISKCARIASSATSAPTAEPTSKICTMNIPNPLNAGTIHILGVVGVEY
jgi:hypothetical protein